MATRIGVVTVSDTRSESSDLSGPAVVAALRVIGFDTFETLIVADDVESIRAALTSMCSSCCAIFTTGGTGFTPRDVTPEATSAMLDKRADSLCELMRLEGLKHTPFSHLSRGIAGVRGGTLIVNLPGSPKGARQGVEALGKLLGPIIEALQGDGCPVEGC